MEWRHTMSKVEDDKPATTGEMKKQFKWQDVAVVLAILSGFIGGYIHLIDEAKAQSDAGMIPLAKRIELVEADQKTIKQDVHETQVDIRALYKAVMTGQKQDRLEVPPNGLDGGGKP
jgi:hypothetical protein